jgi:hypothetical protein
VSKPLTDTEMADCGLLSELEPAAPAQPAPDIAALLAERAVLGRWMAEACGVLREVEQDAEDGGESLRRLRERGERLVRAVLGLDADRAAPSGPQCNLKTPWLAPD